MRRLFASSLALALAACATVPVEAPPPTAADYAALLAAQAASVTPWGRLIQSWGPQPLGGLLLLAGLLGLCYREALSQAAAPSRMRPAEVRAA